MSGDQGEVVHGRWVNGEGYREGAALRSQSHLIVC